MRTREVEEHGGEGKIRELDRKRCTRNGGRRARQEASKPEDESWSRRSMDGLR